MDSEKLSKEQRKANKSRRKFEKEQSRVLKRTGGETQPIEASTILCVRFGNKYSISYVEKLRNMIDRHTTVPYRLYCLTDDPTPINGVTLIVRPNEGYVKGWWHKVHMFDADLPMSGRILYMDLDVVICSSIDKLLNLQGNVFMGIRDFNRKFHRDWKYLNSSVMSWIHGSQAYIYTKFKQNPQVAMSYMVIKIGLGSVLNLLLGFGQSSGYKVTNGKLEIGMNYR